MPEETRRVAPAALPRGNVYIGLRGEFGAISDDQLLAPPCPARGQPAASPWRLALTTVMQCAEGLSDRQAADAVLRRIDWQYALSLEFSDPGSGHTVLSAFRTRLVGGQAELRLLDTVLARVRTRGLLRARGRQRQKTAAVTARHAARAGVEGTHARGIRRCGLRRARDVGLAKTHPQHAITAAAPNSPLCGGRCPRWPLSCMRHEYPR